MRFHQGTPDYPVRVLTSDTVKTIIAEGCGRIHEDAETSPIGGVNFRLPTNRALRGKVRTISINAGHFPLGYRSFAYSDLAAMRMGMSGSASFHSMRKC